jgi:hypothetical protein
MSGSGGTLAASLRQCRGQCRLVAAGDRAQQRVGEFAADRGADLRDLRTNNSWP